jgi:hypothetical protein
MSRYVVGLVLCVLLANPLHAEEAAAPASGNEESNSDLAKKTQNPVADLISVPFQNNFNFNTGPEKRSVWDLNIQPVIPIKLTDDWNLITRTIVPIINQPPLAPGVPQATGLGDINPSFFLSPSGSKEFIWYPAILMREHLSGKIGPADTQDTAYYFLSPGVGVVAMISQEDVEAFWIIHIDTTTGKVLASR